MTHSNPERIARIKELRSRMSARGLAIRRVMIAARRSFQMANIWRERAQEIANVLEGCGPRMRVAEMIAHRERTAIRFQHDAAHFYQVARLLRGLEE